MGVGEGVPWTQELDSAVATPGAEHHVNRQGLNRVPAEYDKSVDASVDLFLSFHFLTVRWNKTALIFQNTVSNYNTINE
jgi:hypothetical protein